MTHPSGHAPQSIWRNEPLSPFRPELRRSDQSMFALYLTSHDTTMRCVCVGACVRACVCVLLSVYLYCTISYLLHLQIITSSTFSVNDQTAAHLAEMASQGIKLLTSWTTAVMELVSQPVVTQHAICIFIMVPVHHAEVPYLLI